MGYNWKELFKDWDKEGKKEEKMIIPPEEFNKTIKEYYDKFEEHWDKALNIYEKLVLDLSLPETPIKEREEGRWYDENAECCGEVPYLNQENIAISDFVRDTFNYYGAENLFSPMTYYHFLFCELCSVRGLDAKKELNDIMKDEFNVKTAEREKTEKSKPLWNALKVS